MRPIASSFKRARSLLLLLSPNNVMPLGCPCAFSLFIPLQAQSTTTLSTSSRSRNITINRNINRNRNTTSTKTAFSTTAPRVQPPTTIFATLSIEDSLMDTDTDTDIDTANKTVLLDGKATAANIRGEIRDKVSARKEAGLSTPGLAVIIVGARKDSQTYVRGKRRACEEAGITSELYELSEDSTSADIQSCIETLNSRADIHGILLQLPLPKHLNEKYLISRIHYSKDVDGFHPLNSGALLQNSSSDIDIAVPCTPKGIIELLERYNVEISGKSACVIGRSNIVGLPISLLLLHKNATVTICHSRTADIAAKVREADIVVAACGRPNFVKGAWLKKGAVVVDVGINAVDDASKKKGYRLVGDVDADEADGVAAFRTPVPGGVGPMTIAMLLENTLEACIRADGK